MEEIRRYILSIISAALIAGILTDITQKTGFQKQMKLVCSVFLAFTFLAPLLRWKLPDLSQSGKSFFTEADQAAALGDTLRLQSIASVIKQESEAYVLKEANQIGAGIEIQIELDYGNPPAPYSATVQGIFDALAEEHLSNILSEELGIPKENQTWIRTNSLKSGNFSPNTFMSS